ncbi:hypothetical protein CKR_3423 [Clostridium kluyveri NBRC 12016]|uniref:Uncharacterized protein n=1 Tax=Clostridium kluyveri (strain NBRC 12016) TaxID=583346 RepID=B9DXN1_CLOK1|nr:hypothetical protein CKR_3423 [Clostridium kluyveri NBRC 12016]
MIGVNIHRSPPLHPHGKTGALIQLRFHFFRSIMHIGGITGFVQLLGIAFGLFHRVKLNGLAVMLAPTLGGSAYRTGAAHRPHAIFLFHSKTSLDLFCGYLPDRDTQLLCFFQLHRHAGGNPVAAEPQLIAGLQHTMPHAKTGFSLDGIMVIQKLRVQKMDSYRRTILLHCIAAGRLCEFYILPYLTGVWRTDVDQLILTHFATACTTVLVMFTAV